MSDLFKTKRPRKTEKRTNGASDSFRGNRYTGCLVLAQNGQALTTAEKNGKELVTSSFAYSFGRALDFWYWQIICQYHDTSSLHLSSSNKKSNFGLIFSKQKVLSQRKPERTYSVVRAI